MKCHWELPIKSSWALSIQPGKAFENLETAENDRNFPEKFPDIPETVEFSEVRIIQPKLNGKKTSGKLGIPREVVFFFLTSSPNLHRIFNFSFQTFRKILVITPEFVKQPVYRYLCLHEAHWSLI